MNECRRRTSSDAGRTCLATAPLNSCFFFLCAGPIPPKLGNLSALQNLVLETNKLSGELGGERVDHIPRHKSQHECLRRTNPDAGRTCFATSR